MQTKKNETASGLLMPLPKHVEQKDGAFRLHMGTTISYDPIFGEVVELAREQLACNIGGEDILFKLVEGFGEDCYRLKVGKNQIVVSSTYPSGGFRALQTLRQMALANDNLIPCCLIEDEPAFPWRGFMLDCSRHFFSVAFIKKLIDVASMHHLNRFHWHLTDDQGWRLTVEGYERLEEVASKRTLLSYTDGRTYGGVYTDEEILEVQAYAHKRHMLVVPEIETPGHASALLSAYPTFGCTGGPYEVQDRWGIFDEVMCAGNDNLLQFLQEVITKTARLFSDPYIHIGGDECPHTAWETCPKCRQRMEEQGLASVKELQSWMTSQVCTMVEKAGKRPIGWDEVLEGTEKLGIPSSLIVMSWRGDAGGIEASSLGHDVIMCPNTAGCYFDYKHLPSFDEPGNIGVTTIEKTAQFSPIPKGISKEAQCRILGGQGNLWTEKVTSAKAAEYMFFPRLSVMAERLWNPQPFASVEERRPSLEKKLTRLDINLYRGASV
ncbi:beta-N-acetylhexosaminidase [Sphaerochaeta sp. PS]|uniref:beta-N-acetylhexosaminidase n=1 Tax=Sphaerochaeta sp. PS TaxID=3076336 RepID=UPI0028A2FD71|nr:beta-N-acetylhexosaminidase [Sphaerochaeta sp. PS]MDT4763135.1 beta-N-acetylhexosaminidase [Sphaerochaeta sp. PS]